MSKPNKVNKSNYDQGGRLTPDEMARERKRQAEVSGHAWEKPHVMEKPPARPPARTPRPAGRGSSRPRNEHEE